ncbi:unnamed protein product [Caenorhabditis brenneri]
MKLWRFFPILVKIEVLKNMDLSDKLSFLKCSKKCRNLISRVPNHISFFKIPKQNRFSMLITCRKSTIQKFKVEIETDDERDQVEQFLNEIQHSLKVKKLVMEISPEYSEMYKKCIDLCDPFFIESIEIEGLDSPEVYEDISKTPQWKNSRQVSLNSDFDGFLKVNINDFLHFKAITLKVEELSVDGAWKLVQNFVNTASQDDRIDITSQNPINTDLMRQKIETELVGDWKGMAYAPVRYITHPENPELVLECFYDDDMFNVSFRTQFDEFRPWDLD